MRFKAYWKNLWGLVSMILKPDWKWLISKYIQLAASTLKAHEPLERQDTLSLAEKKGRLFGCTPQACTPYSCPVLRPKKKPRASQGHHWLIHRMLVREQHVHWVWQLEGTSGRIRASGGGGGFPVLGESTSGGLICCPGHLRLGAGASTQAAANCAP